MSKTSVDLEKCVSIDAMAESGHDISMEALTESIPDMQECGGACWKTMHEIALRNPRACLVLLASGMGRMSMRDIGKALDVNFRHLSRQVKWLRKHYPVLASVLKK